MSLEKATRSHSGCSCASHNTARLTEPEASHSWHHFQQEHICLMRKVPLPPEGVLQGDSGASEMWDSWDGGALCSKPLISDLTPGWLPLLTSLSQDLELQSERQDVVSGGGTSFQVIWRLPPLLPYVNKNLIKEGEILIKKKEEEKVKKEKKGGKERENNALFSIKINKMQYIQISHRPGPWERRVRPSQAQGGREEGSVQGWKGGSKVPSPAITQSCL